MMDMLDKAKFTKGDLPGFRAFLRQKAPKARFSWNKD